MSPTLRTPAADADTGGSSLQAASRILTLLNVIYLTLLSSGLARADSALPVWGTGAKSCKRRNPQMSHIPKQIQPLACACRSGPSSNRLGSMVCAVWERGSPKSPKRTTTFARTSQRVLQGCCNPCRCTSAEQVIPGKSCTQSSRDV